VCVCACVCGSGVARSKFVVSFNSVHYVLSTCVSECVCLCACVSVVVCVRVINLLA